MCSETNETEASVGRAALLVERDRGCDGWKDGCMHAFVWLGVGIFASGGSYITVADLPKAKGRNLGGYSSLA